MENDEANAGHGVNTDGSGLAATSSFDEPESNRNALRGATRTPHLPVNPFQTRRVIGRYRGVDAL